MVAHALASLLARPHGGSDGGLIGVLFGGVILIIVLIAILFFYLFFCFLLSRIFVKANKPALAAFIPIWNLIVILEMVGKPIWFILLFLIPGVNLFMVPYIKALLLERFGIESPMSWVLAIGGIFFPIITFVLLVWGAFGDVRYQAPSAFGGASPAY
jgi:hypothetical protein